MPFCFEHLPPKLSVHVPDDKYGEDTTEDSVYLNKIVNVVAVMAMCISVK